MTDKTDIAALRDRAECMANLLDNLAGYEPQDIDMDAVELRFEDESGGDTGCDISIVGTAQQSAGIIRALLVQLEAERQQREAAEKERDRIDGRNAELNSTLERWSVERAENANEIEALRAALRGAQEPVGLIKRKTPLLSDGAFRYSFISDVNLPLDTELFTRQHKPVVVLPKSHYVAGCADKFMSEREVKKALKSAGIVVKDGE